MDITNLGSAPVYESCTVTLALYGPDEECLWIQTDAQTDLRTLLPGETLQIGAAIPREELDDDEQYTLTVQINDEMGNPYLPMALADEISDKEYALAVFSVDR